MAFTQTEERDPLERATERANEAMDKAGVPREEPAEPREREERPEPRAPEADFSAQLDRITIPAHDRFRESRRDRQMREAMEAMEKRVLERVEALVPKPAKPEPPKFEDDPVAWQEHRDREFKESLVEEIAQRVAPPQDPESAGAEAELGRRQREVGEATVEYVGTTWQSQGYPSPQEAHQAMNARAQAYQEIRTREIMQERGVDYDTATAWRNQEVVQTYQWAVSNGKHPIAVLDSLAMRKIHQYTSQSAAGQAAPEKREMDDDAKERRAAAASGMAGGVGTAAAPRNGDSGPLKRTKLSDVPKDRTGYRLFVLNNRQPGESFASANQRIQAHYRRQG